MIKAFSIVVVVVLAGCAGTSQRQHSASPCFASEASYDCQVERYHNVNAN